MSSDEIIVVRCPWCGDTYEITNDVLGLDCSNLPESMTLDEYVRTEQFGEALNWWMTEKDCWTCGKVYKPLHYGKKMFPEVFNSLKNCKM